MKNATTALTPLLILLVTISTANAKILHWPNYCDNGTLQITNSSNENQFVWLQSFSENLKAENEYEVESKSTLNISVQKLFKEERNSLLQFANQFSLKTKFNCNKLSYVTDDADGGKFIFSKTQTGHHKLILQNLSSLENKIQLKIIDSNNQDINLQQITLNTSESFSVSLDEFQSWRSIEVSSDLKYTAFVLTETGYLPPKLSPSKGIAEKDGVYFLVGVRENEDDSFVVKITDSKLIAQARELVAKPEHEKIVFAKIEKGHKFFNRNFNNKSKSYWSWSTSEVTGFGDFGSTSCNGHPQAVEDRLESWISNPGRICFWDYRLKKELSLEEVNSGFLRP